MRLARDPRSFKLNRERFAGLVAGTCLWIGVVACLHRCGGIASLPNGLVPLHRPKRSTASESTKVFDIWTIIFLALAVFVFLRLRSVLGQRTGRERPPYDPYSVRRSTGDKVVAMPARAGDAPTPTEGVRPVESTEPGTTDHWKGIAQPGSALASALDAIVAEDRSFDPKHFLAGARAAYEMIVTAYAEGDRRTLKNLLSREVYDSFDTVIREREARGETAETRFVSIDATDITAADLRARTAQITVRFLSHLVTVTRDRAGHVVDGNPDKVTDVTDIWTFARDLSSRDPNWKLVATEAGH
jgi:predicted lipid-binding transport protein (Tim44 family)